MQPLADYDQRVRITGICVVHEFVPYKSRMMQRQIIQGPDESLNKQALW